MHTHAVSHAVVSAALVCFLTKRAIQAYRTHAPTPGACGLVYAHAPVPYCFRTKPCTSAPSGHLRSSNVTVKCITCASNNRHRRPNVFANHPVIRPAKDMPLFAGLISIHSQPHASVGLIPNTYTNCMCFKPRLRIASAWKWQERARVLILVHGRKAARA